MATNTETQNQVLSDDEHKSFSGATLQIDNADNQTGHEPGVDFTGPSTNFNRNRPGSAYGRQSIRSTTSRTSVRPGVIKSDVESGTFFSYKVCTFDVNFPVDSKSQNDVSFWKNTVRSDFICKRKNIPKNRSLYMVF